MAAVPSFRLVLVSSKLTGRGALSTCVSVATLRNWEQGRRQPHGPARALLKVAAANPKAVEKALGRR